MEKSSFGNVVRNSLMLRLCFIGVLILVFLAPLSMVKSVVWERTSYYDSAVQSIATSWAEEQTVMGPVLVVPYKTQTEVETFNHKTRLTEVQKYEHQKYHHVLPEELKATVDLVTEERYRGIYKVPVYNAALKMDGRFSKAFDGITTGKNEVILGYGKAYLSFYISDVRGIGGDLDLLWNGDAQSARPGSEVTNVPSGVHVLVDALSKTKPSGTFAVEMNLKGIKEFHFVPAGKNSEFEMTSNWPHPSFSGRFLPSEREIGEDGFSAQWETGFLATDMEGRLMRCVSSNQCHELWDNVFSVNLFKSVDIYQKTERSLKYGLLFISLTFGAFFVFEAMKSFRIHPIQYGLVGMALAVFYLLLVSLSEHVSFGLAYLVASLAIAGLLGYYVSFVIKSTVWGLFFGGLIGGLYGVLYTILGSEDYALLMGSGLLFFVLAVVMFVTRGVDWYKISKKGD